MAAPLHGAEREFRMAVMQPGETQWRDVRVASSQGDLWQHIQALVGGPFQDIGFGCGATIDVHEEGLILRLPTNRVGAAALSLLGFKWHSDPGRTIYGPVVVMGGVDEDGATQPLGDVLWEKLRAAALACA